MSALNRFSRPAAFWLSLVIIAGMIVRGWQSHSLQAQQVGTVAQTGGSVTANPVDKSTYFHVQSLRNDLALTDGDLSAIGCDQSTATNVLSTLLTWYSVNKTTLQQAEQAKSAAVASFQEANRQIHVGSGKGLPRNETLISSFSTLQQAVAQAEQQRQQVLAGAVNQITPLLPSSAGNLWTNARNNLAAPAEVRYAPTLTVQQLQTLTLAASQGNGVTNVLASTLSGPQMQAVQLAAQNAATYGDAASAAELAVLPSPVKPPLNSSAVSPTSGPAGQ